MRERVNLQRPGRPRAGAELGAHWFQRWLGEVRETGGQAYVARDGSHAIAVWGEELEELEERADFSDETVGEAA